MPKKEAKKDSETHARSLAAKRGYKKRRMKIARIVMVSFLVLLMLFVVYVIVIGPTLNSYVAKEKSEAFNEGVNKGIDMAKQDIYTQLQDTHGAYVQIENLTLIPYFDRQLNISG